MADRDKRVVLHAGKTCIISGTYVRARDVHHGGPVGFGLVRIAFFASCLFAVGCSTVETAEFDNVPTTGGDAAVDDVPLPNADTSGAVPDTAEQGDDAAIGDGDVPCTPTSDGQGTLCITVTNGAAGPLIDDDARGMYIDGLGALTVAVFQDQHVRDEKAVATRTFPSATSGVAFAISSELPKVATLSVPPGTYWILPAFQDREPFGRRDLEPGDYVPKIDAQGPFLTKVVVAANQATKASIDIYPVREIDVDVSLGGALKPIGSGAGPMTAALLSSAGAVTGVGALPCGSVADGGAATIRVFTNDVTETFGLKVGLFDFAQSLDDSTISLDSPPPGALVEEGLSYVKLPSTAWIAPAATATLRKAIPFTSTVPTDPTPECTAANVAPVK